MKDELHAILKKQDHELKIRVDRKGKEVAPSELQVKFIDQALGKPIQTVYCIDNSDSNISLSELSPTQKTLKTGCNCIVL